jgi:hypothetical protein
MHLTPSFFMVPRFCTNFLINPAKKRINKTPIGSFNQNKNILSIPILYDILQKILGQMAHNVPAVCDVLAARIRALRSKDQGRQNVAEVLRGNEA